MKLSHYGIVFVMMLLASTYFAPFELRVVLTIGALLFILVTVIIEEFESEDLI